MASNIKKKKTKAEIKNEWYEVGEEYVLFPIKFLTACDPKQKKRKNNTNSFWGYLNLN